MPNLMITATNYTGAGAIVFVEEETTELKQPVCKRGSILLGELIAIKIYRLLRASGSVMWSLAAFFTSCLVIVL
jgi:hypothetical protein